MDMFDEQLERFSQSNRQIESRKLAEIVRSIRDSIKLQWEGSLSGDDAGREECYRELHGLKVVMSKLFNEV